MLLVYIGWVMCEFQQYGALLYGTVRYSIPFIKIGVYGVYLCLLVGLCVLLQQYGVQLHGSIRYCMLVYTFDEI